MQSHLPYQGGVRLSKDRGNWQLATHSLDLVCIVDTSNESVVWDNVRVSSRTSKCQKITLDMTIA